MSDMTESDVHYSSPERGGAERSEAEGRASTPLVYRAGAA